MSLRRYTRSVDGTIPVQALLYEDEELLVSQDGIGIYDGTEKSAPHQSGTTHTTTHRLFYIDATQPVTRSFELDLSLVLRTEHYAGLFTSSPKITLHFHQLDSRSGEERAVADVSAGRVVSSDGDLAFQTWTCEVCNYRNPPGLSPAASRVCSLCGVPRSAIHPTIDIPTAQTHTTSPRHLSTSLPSSSLNLTSLSISSASSPQPISPPQEGRDEIACVACTFLNHPALSTCEICGTPLPKPSNMSASSGRHALVKSAPSSRPTSPSPGASEGPDPRMIRLSFRKGGDKAFYAVLRRTLLAKGWEIKGTGKGTVTKGAGAGASGPGHAHSATLSGINGILRNVETTAATSQTDLEDSLKDLEALMIKWRDMVKLAQDLNDRLTAASSSTSVASPQPGAAITNAAADGGVVTMTTQAVEPEEATFIRSSLAQLGLQMTNAPVTLDMIRDERKWIAELARELAGVLQGTEGRDRPEGIMRKRGIIGLDEVWGGWNRARGVALIPPSTFLQVLPQLSMYTSPPINIRTFASSGLCVLHTPPYTRAAFTARLVSHLTLTGPKTTVEVAQEESLPIGLTQEMVGEIEDQGEICRDEGESGVGILDSRWGEDGSGGEVKWWVNVFRGYEWDGQAG